MEGKARMPVRPLAHLWMLVGGVVVEDHVHDFFDRHLRLVAGLTDEVVSEVIGTNLLAPIALTRHLLPSMIERRSRLIVFINSISGYIALPTAAVYTPTKICPARVRRIAPP